jgi:hypothetical protein
VTFFSHPEVRRERHKPFAVTGSGSSRESFDGDEVFYVQLDLGGTRRGRLDELLAALDGSVRERIVRAAANRSREVLYAHSRDDFELVREAVQAWADRVSGWA